MHEPTSGQEPEAPAGPDESVPTAAPGGPAATAAPAEAADPAGPQPLGVVVTPTEDAAVDARLRRLAAADHLPVSGHLDVYEDVHRGLREVLAALDQRPGPPAPSSTTHDNRS
jgi:hypothetical protein